MCLCLVSRFSLMPKCTYGLQCRFHLLISEILVAKMIRLGPGSQIKISTTNTGCTVSRLHYHLSSTRFLPTPPSPRQETLIIIDRRPTHAVNAAVPDFIEFVIITVKCGDRDEVHLQKIGEQLFRERLLS